MSVLIVGNGSTLLDKKNGAKIDSFERIVRFNSFKIKRFEDFVGARTTTWVTCNACHLGEKFDEVIFHSWTKDKTKDPAFQKIKAKHPNAKTLSLDLIKDANELLNVGQFKAPSTGLLAILHFLKTEGKVTITGFDWWSNERHHYGDNEPRGKLHEPNLEMKVINELIFRERLCFL